KKGSSLGILFPDAPVRDGYDFVGWATAQNTDIPNFNRETVITSDLTVYAIWKEKAPEQVIVRFVSEGTELHKLPVNKGSSLGNLFPADPTREGYDFLGWTTANSAGTPNFGSNTPVSNDLTVHAVWDKRPVEGVNVAFVDGENILTTVTGARGEGLGDRFPADPVREDYEFLGWTVTPGGTVPDFNATTPLTSDTFAYALWRYAPKQYTITVEHYRYDKDIEKADLAGTDTVTVTRGQSFSPQRRSYSGYTFQTSVSGSSIDQVKGDTLLRLYYKKNGKLTNEEIREENGYYRLSADPSVELSVNDRHPSFRSNALTFAEFVELVNAVSVDSITGQVRGGAMLSNLSSPDFSELNFSVITADFSQEVTLVAEWENGEEATAVVRVRIIDETPPEILLPQRKLTYGSSDAHPVSEKELRKAFEAAGMEAYDNYSGQIDMETAYLGVEGFSDILWSVPGEYIIYFKATDESGNHTRKAGIISIQP
ncbi:MAG: InlB B-repeat-containing protein, partial [Oscillospiraceae bacterium]